MPASNPMTMAFQTDLAVPYRSRTQAVRVMSEAWAHENLYCTNCGAERMIQQRANNIASDFICPKCNEEYELKSASGIPGKKVVNGAYATLIARLSAGLQPNLILLGYSAISLTVDTVRVVPRQFFTAQLVEPRFALSPDARRAGWTGCNILVGELPRIAVLDIVEDGAACAKADVLAKWSATKFLCDQADDHTKRWLIETMKSIEQLQKAEFHLSELYADEPRLHLLFPDNAHVREKIRQQLQRLRDRGYLQFLGCGRYRLNPGACDVDRVR